jgi:hypothetical protein
LFFRVNPLGVGPLLIALHTYAAIVLASA